MSYEPYYPGGWSNYPSRVTPIVAAALNHMEQGISDAFSAGVTPEQEALLAQVEAATSAATPDLLAKRDANGDASFRFVKLGQTPLQPQDAANKKYVDDSALSPAERLLLGQISAATPDPDPDTLAKRDALGRLGVATPVNPGDATPKNYVDSAISNIREVPAGGTTGQVLAKNSGTDYDVKWEDDSGSGFTPPPGGFYGDALTPADSGPGYEWVGTVPRILVDRAEIDRPSIMGPVYWIVFGIFPDSAMDGDLLQDSGQGGVTYLRVAGDWVSITGGGGGEALPPITTSGKYLETIQNGPSTFGAAWANIPFKVVRHGVNVSATRPQADVVWWIGTAEPANALAHDVWDES